MKNRKLGKNSRWWTRHRRTRKENGSVFISHNFSDVEDDAYAFEIIRDLAADAGRHAAAEAKAAGLSRAYIRNYQYLVRVSPNGEEIVIHPRTTKSSFYIKYRPHTVLHASRK
jgi:hypothetical protein